MFPVGLIWTGTPLKTIGVDTEQTTATLLGGVLSKLPVNSLPSQSKYLNLVLKGELFTNWYSFNTQGGIVVVVVVDVEVVVVVGGGSGRHSRQPPSFSGPISSTITILSIPLIESLRPINVAQVETPLTLILYTYSCVGDIPSGVNNISDEKYTNPLRQSLNALLLAHLKYWSKILNCAVPSKLQGLLIVVVVVVTGSVVVVVVGYSSIEILISTSSQGSNIVVVVVVVGGIVVVVVVVVGIIQSNNASKSKTSQGDVVVVVVAGQGPTEKKSLSKSGQSDPESKGPNW